MINFLLNNFQVILTAVLIPFLFSIVKTGFNSFALDDFDLLFLNREKRSLLNTIKISIIKITLTLIILAAFFFSGFFMQLNKNILQFYLIAYIVFIILFIFWLFYFYVIQNIILFYKSLKSINFKRKEIYNLIIKFKANKRLKKIDANIKYFFVYFSGVTAATLFLVVFINNIELNTGNNWMFILLVLIFSFLLVEMAKNNSVKYSIHYKFVGNFQNLSPVKLYLDRIIDNSTHILSDKDKKYKAIKYFKNEHSEFVIELYQVEERKVQKNKYG